MRVFFLIVATLSLLFVAGFGGLRGYEQFSFADDAAGVTGPLQEAGDIGHRVSEAVGEDGALARGVKAFTSGADDQVSALQRGAIGMMGLAVLALLLLISAAASARGAVMFFAFLVVAGAVATWILNPENGPEALAGLTQRLVDMGPMSDTSPKTVALMLGGGGIVGALTALMAAMAGKRGEA